MTQTSTIDKRAVMAGHWLLRGLQPAELDRLLRHVRLERFPPNAVIFHKGDTGTAMMAVAEGRVKISAPAPDGRSVVLNIIDEGEMFGEIALLDGGERTDDATRHLRKWFYHAGN